MDSEPILENELEINPNKNDNAFKQTTEIPFKYALALARARVIANSNNLPNPNIKNLLETPIYSQVRKSTQMISELTLTKERKEKLKFKLTKEEVRVQSLKKQKDAPNNEEAMPLTLAQPNNKLNNEEMIQKDLIRQKGKMNVNKNKIEVLKIKEDKSIRKEGFSCLGCGCAFQDKQSFITHRDNECERRNLDEIAINLKENNIEIIDKGYLVCYCLSSKNKYKENDLNNNKDNELLVQCEWCLGWLHYSCFLNDVNISGANGTSNANMNLNEKLPVELPNILYCKNCLFNFPTINPITIQLRTNQFNSQTRRLNKLNNTLPQIKIQPDPKTRIDDDNYGTQLSKFLANIKRRRVKSKKNDN